MLEQPWYIHGKTFLRQRSRGDFVPLLSFCPDSQHCRQVLGSLLQSLGRQFRPLGRSIRGLTRAPQREGWARTQAGTFGVAMPDASTSLFAFWDSSIKVSGDSPTRCNSWQISPARDAGKGFCRCKDLVTDTKNIKHTHKHMHTPKCMLFCSRGNAFSLSLSPQLFRYPLLITGAQGRFLLLLHP